MILPIKKTPFTLSKSANRPVTAIVNGLIVISDLIPSYQKLRDFMVSPVDALSLNRVISMSREERNKLSNMAFEHAIEEYSLKRISEKWESFLFAVHQRKLSDVL